MKKLSISILLLFVMILSITAVAAADDVTSDLAKSQIADDSAALAVDDNTDVLAAGGNFTQFQKAIDDGIDGVIISNPEYTMKSGEKAVVISKQVTISGGTIDAAGFGTIFNVTSAGKLTLSGVTLKNGNATNGGAIYNDGEISIQNTNTISTNNATLGGAIYNNGIINFVGATTTFTDDTAKTGADIYNTKDGQITIGAGSTFGGSIYNEGTLTAGASTYDGEIINNGTIDSITGSINGALTNYGTITTINSNNIAVPITNNGTITTFKGKTTDKITNNGNIGTINATIAELENNGDITTIVDTTATGAILTNNGTIGDISKSDLGIFRNNGTVTSIDASTFTNTISNYENATIGTIKNLVTDKKIINQGTITTIDNVTVTTNFDNYGAVVTINNCTFLSTSRNYKNATIGTISSTVFTKSLSNYATIGLIEDSNITAKLNNDGVITTIDNVTIGQVANINGNITNIVNSVFNDDVYIGHNVNIVTIDNVTFKGEVTSDSENVTIGTIEKCVFEGTFTNDANITSIINVTFNGLFDTDYATIGTIDGCVFNAGFANCGENVIGTIKNTLFNNTYFDNSGNITSIDASIFNATSVSNEGKATISNSKFYDSGRILNKGVLAIDASEFINGTANNYGIVANSKGVLTVTGTKFTNITGNSGVIYNNGNMTVSNAIFENNVQEYAGAIFNAAGANATVIGSTFTNNTASNEIRGNAIYNKGNLTLSGNTINTAHADIVNTKADGFITAVKLTVTNNNTVYNYATPVNLTATLTDDAGNWIYDMGAIDFVINGTVVGQPTAYNNTTGVYLLSVTLAAFADANVTNADQTVTANLTAKYVNATATVTDGTLKTIKGTFTELQYLIDNAGTNLVLPYDFAYNAEFDNVNLTKGVVLNQAITIEGNGSTISGANVARIFFANATGIQIKNMTLINGNADNGSAIYVNNTAYIYNVTFTDNVAAENGGAIYATGEYATITYSTFKNNVANAGNAIYVNAGRLSEYNNTISNTTADIVNFNGTLATVKLNITILGNKTINATYGEAVTLTAIIADTNGNLINDPFFYFTISTDKIAAVFDAASNTYVADTKLYYGPNVYEVGLKTNRTHSAQVLTVATGAYNISKAAPTLVVDIPNVVTGQNATVTLTLTGANGDGLNATDVPVIVNNKEYKVNINNGTGNVTLPVLDNGVYNAFVNYTGDDNYNGSYVATDFAVRTATKMTVTASDVTYDGATIAVTLTDGNGTPLTKFVTVTVDGKDYTVAVTNGAGSQVITGLAANKAYTVTAAFAGDADYDQASAETIFTIAAATVTAENIKRGVNSPFDYYVTVTDANGNPIADKEITIYVNGTKYTAKTNATGIATVAAGLTVVNETATVYDVIVVNPDTGANKTATTTIVPRIVVLSGDLTADYLENPPYIVQAFGDDGNPVGEGEIVTVVFSGHYYYMPTNATGHVVRTIGLAPGLYAVKAGYKDYNATATIFSVKQILTASSGTLKKTAKSYTLKATLKNTNGKAIAGKEVKLTFNGKTYKVKTNSKGVASYTIKSSVISKLTAGKTYKLTAKYVNDLTKGKYVGKIKVVKK